jgi:hypothetical protein
MTEIAEDKTKRLKEENECCPACTNIELCRAYNESGETRFPKTYKWSERCCDKCADVTCLQNPFYVLSLGKNLKEEDQRILVDYKSEALSTILKL